MTVPDNKTSVNLSMHRAMINIQQEGHAVQHSKGENATVYIIANAALWVNIVLRVISPRVRGVECRRVGWSVRG